MSSADRPSQRLVEQRLRNRAMESLDTLSQGDEGVQAVGFVEYFEQFFDVIDDDGPWPWRQWTCFTPEEVRALDAVQQILLEASAATPRLSAEKEFASSGWPSRIQPSAIAAMDLMRARGRFREDIEEDEPSLPG
jgi:hypothetical protein